MKRDSLQNKDLRLDNLDCQVGQLVVLDVRWHYWSENWRETIDYSWRSTHFSSQKRKWSKTSPNDLESTLSESYGI